MFRIGLPVIFRVAAIRVVPADELPEAERQLQRGSPADVRIDPERLDRVLDHGSELHQQNLAILWDPQARMKLPSASDESIRWREDRLEDSIPSVTRPTDQQLMGTERCDHHRTLGHLLALYIRKMSFVQFDLPHARSGSSDESRTLFVKVAITLRGCEKIDI